MADRDKNGRFQKGHSVKSPGRKPRATEAEYLDKMFTVGDLEAWGKATEKMLKLAQGGDVPAYRALLPYFAGLPVQKLQLSSAESATLAQVLDTLKSRGIPASDVFNAILSQLADESVTVDEDETDEDESY